MLDSNRPFLISPPFGSYLRHCRAYSVLGSFTRYQRTGRTGQVLRTVRHVPGGWINKIGLRNGGEPALSEAFGRMPDRAKIVSVALIDGDDSEWAWLISRLTIETAGGIPRIVEINGSCPNLNHPISALPSATHLRKILELPDLMVIFKLQPFPSSIDAAVELANSGACYIHLSNTLPTPIGGVSGTALREVNLPLVAALANRLVSTGFHRVEIIGGGGIYAPEHLQQYRDAGASRFSLSTAWFWPPRALRTMRAMRLTIT